MSNVDNTGSAAAISASTTVQLSMTQLLVGIAGLVGGAWLVFSTTTAGLRDDVGAIRQSISSLQAGEKDGIRQVGATDQKLTGEIAALRVAIVGLDGRVVGFDNKLDGLSKSMGQLTSQLGDVQKQLSVRQASHFDQKSLEALSAVLKGKGDDRQIIIVPMNAETIRQPR